MTVKIILHQTAKGTNKNAQKQNRLCSRKPQIIFQYSVLECMFILNVVLLPYVCLCALTLYCMLHVFVVLAW